MLFRDGRPVPYKCAGIMSYTVGEGLAPIGGNLKNQEKFRSVEPSPRRGRGTARGPQQMQSICWDPRCAVDEDATREQTNLFSKKLVLYAEHTHPSFAPRSFANATFSCLEKAQKRLSSPLWGLLLPRKCFILYIQEPLPSFPCRKEGSRRTRRECRPCGSLRQARPQQLFR